MCTTHRCFHLNPKLPTGLFRNPNPQDGRTLWNVCFGNCITKDDANIPSLASRCHLWSRSHYKKPSCIRCITFTLRPSGRRSRWRRWPELWSPSASFQLNQCGFKLNVALYLEWVGGRVHGWGREYKAFVDMEPVCGLSNGGRGAIYVIVTVTVCCVL